MTGRVTIRPGHVEPRYCPDPDKHEGLRNSMDDMKQHMVDVHGFVYAPELAPRERKVVAIHRVADEWRDCVLVCSCDWRTAARMKTEARRQWLVHAESVHP